MKTIIEAGKRRFSVLSLVTYLLVKVLALIELRHQRLDDSGEAKFSSRYEVKTSPNKGYAVTLHVESAVIRHLSSEDISQLRRLAAA
ncbi:MAG: hypothetical protein IJ228_00720 [Succinivibrio sp.]|nr:hypothetical protein [Succinivibrio sp.]